MSEPAGAKRTRTRIRLEHPLAANEEIDVVLPKSLEEFEESLVRGGVKELAQLLGVCSASSPRASASTSSSSL